jgi:uncharacterized membrane protein
MIWMLLGLVLFAGVHLSSAIVPGMREGARASLGEAGFRIGYSLAVLAGLALIVLGWQRAGVHWWYAPSPALRTPAICLILIGFYLLVVSLRKSRVKRLLRHPQLTGTLLWAVGHLLLNGESRSVVLFVVLALWSVAEVILINRRDLRPPEPRRPSWLHELFTLLITLLVIAFATWLHPWIAGVPVLR